MCDHCIEKENTNKEKGKKLIIKFSLVQLLWGGHTSF